MTLDVLILAFVCAGLLCALVALYGVVVVLSRSEFIGRVIDAWMPEHGEGWWER